MQWLGEIFAAAQSELGLDGEVSAEAIIDSIKATIEFHAKLGKKGSTPVKAETIALGAFGIRVPELESEFDVVYSYLGKLVEEGVLVKNGGGYSLPTSETQLSIQSEPTLLGLSQEQLEGVLKKMSRKGRKRSIPRGDGGYSAWESDRRWLDEQNKRQQRHPFN